MLLIRQRISRYHLCAGKTTTAKSNAALQHDAAMEKIARANRVAIQKILPTRNLWHGHPQGAGAEPTASPKQNKNKKSKRKGADFMQTQKVEREKSNAQSSRFSQRIGSTIYSVSVYFKEGSKETLEEKMFRMMKSDLEKGRVCGSTTDLNNGRFYGNITLPQADALPERGSI